MAEWTLKLSPLDDIALANTLQDEGGMKREPAQHFQKDAEAISRLHIHGLISDAAATTARKRLVKRIRDALTDGMDVPMKGQQ